MIRPDDHPSPHGRHGPGEGPHKPGDHHAHGPGQPPAPAAPPAAGAAGKAAEPPANEAAGKSAFEETLAAKTRECQELVDQIKRVAADFSNYQKRADRRMEDDRRLIVRDLVLDLLPGIDNLERTIAAAEKAPDAKVLLDGVRMAHQQLLAALKKHGVTPIETSGEQFSPEHHEAVAHVPSAEHAEGRIIEEFQKGYRQHGATLRPSRVAVSKGKPQDEPNKADEE